MKIFKTANYEKMAQNTYQGEENYLENLTREMGQVPTSDAKSDEKILFSFYFKLKNELEGMDSMIKIFEESPLPDRVLHEKLLSSLFEAKKPLQNAFAELKNKLDEARGRKSEVGFDNWNEPGRAGRNSWDSEGTPFTNPDYPESN